MLIPTNFYRCILCLAVPPDSNEHIFPESIGGRFQARILCASCNNNRCSKIAKLIQKDSWYLTALTNLKNELPDLYSRTFFQYVSKTPDGTIIKSSIKNGAHKVTTTSSIDGVLIADEKDTPKIIRGILSKEGYDKSEIKKWEQTFIRMPTNTEIKLPFGRVLQKQAGPPLMPKFEDNCTCELAATLIGYEFLALLMGNGIYDDRFANIREFIKGYPLKENIIIEKLINRAYRPRHEIDFVQNDRQLSITVKFFGASVYRIIFPEFVGGIKDICFVEDIKQKKSFLAFSHEDARNGMFINMSDAWNHKPECSAK